MTSIIKLPSYTTPLQYVFFDLTQSNCETYIYIMLLYCFFPHLLSQLPQLLLQFLTLPPSCCSVLPSCLSPLHEYQHFIIQQGFAETLWNHLLHGSLMECDTSHTSNGRSSFSQSPSVWVPPAAPVPPSSFNLFTLTSRSTGTQCRCLQRSSKPSLGNYMCDTEARQGVKLFITSNASGLLLTGLLGLLCEIIW